MIWIFRNLCLSVVLVPAVVTRAPAQVPADTSAARSLAVELVTIGSSGEDRSRLDQLLGRAATSGFLIRDASTLSPTTPLSDGGAVRLFYPELVWVQNASLPFSLNQGSLWAGRGYNFLARGGLRAWWRNVDLMIAPELAVQQNAEFQTLHPAGDDLHPYASPWHAPPESIDLPQRYGDRGFTRLYPGQSSLTVRAGRVAAGVSTANQWWGPGLRTALVLSNNAPGIPHAFLRTTSPLPSRAGDFEGRWMLGVLSESDYFDDRTDNDRRSFNGLALTFRPAFDPDLTVGFARVVYAPLDDLGGLPARIFHTFHLVGQPNDQPATAPAGDPGPDQVFSFFGRWVLPASGAEVYAEWARSEEPRSLRDFLETPQHTQAYTVGLQWAHELASRGVLRLQAESSSTEASSTFRHRRVIGFYKSRAVAQGYSHHGRILGAATGTGSSAQWMAFDYLRPDWSVGVLGGRIRWENDAFYVEADGLVPVDHDVNVWVGVRGSLRARGVDTDGTLEYGTRLNYLFQNPSLELAGPLGVDVRNLTATLRIRPLAGR